MNSKALRQAVRVGTAGLIRWPALAALVLSLAAAGAHAAEAAATAPPADEPLPVAFVDTMNKLAGGPYPGYRANHAKGVLVTGTFTPAKSAASLSKAPQFAAAVPVLVRFSDPTGLPTIPDASPQASPHGIAIRFDLPGGANADMVCLSANSFPVSKPEDFLAMLRAIGASGPGAAKPTPIETFLAGHPAAAKWVSTPRPPPQSFATLAYYGINAFKFTNASGKSRYGRYEILPDAGQKVLAEAEVAKADPNYLIKELPARLAKGAVNFHLFVQLAKPGDVTDDATVVWPASRDRIALGTLTLTKMVPDQETAQKTLVYFNPLALPEGIDPSDDPILLARPPAYGVSFGRRTQ
jgi:catalase